jgi:hypothetical protein
MIRKANIATVVEILERLEHKVDEHLIEDRAVFKAIRESLDGCDEYPGVRGRLDRLEQVEKRRGKLIGGLYAAFCAAAIGYGFAYLPR